MSPEQLRGETVTKSCDLWALAVISYEMLTGTYPFRGSTLAEYQQAMLAGSAVPLREHIPNATPAIDRLFAAALSPDCKKRPPSANALLAQLEATLSIATGVAT
jgi:serine/threonine protein kinase